MNSRLRLAVVLLAASGCAHDRPIVYPKRPKVAVRPSAEPALTNAGAGTAEKAADRAPEKEPF